MGDQLGIGAGMRKSICLLAVAGAVAGLVAVGGAYVAYGSGVFEYPSDNHLLAEFVAQRPLFEAVRDRAARDPKFAGCGAGLLDAWCTGRDQAAYKAFFAKTGSNFLFRDYDGMTRVGFARGGVLLAIGPGWIKGVEYIPGDPNRAGELVRSTDGANRLPEGVYIRPLRDGWYIFYQRTD